MATSNLRFRIIGDDDASPAFLQVAAAAKLLNATFSDLGRNTLGLTKLIGGAGLIPIAAGATAAVTELSVSLTAAAGAAGVFGLSVVGVGADMVKQQKAITTLDTKLSGLSKGTDEYRQTAQKLHTAQKDFNRDFGPAAKGLDDMKSAFSRFKDATRDVTVGVMGKAFELLASVLPKLVPISNAAGVAVGGLIDELQRWTKSSQFAGLLDFFEKSGPRAITTFGHIIGNIFEGVGGILSNFVKPGDHAAKTLERLTDNFARWGRSKGVSDSVNKFLRYVSDNSPEINAALGALAEAAPKIAVAMGELGSLNLSVMSKFLQLIAGLPQKQFNLIAESLFAIAASSKAIAAVSGLRALGTGLAGLARGGAGGGGGVAGGVFGGVQKVFVTNPGFGGTGGGGGGPVARAASFAEKHPIIAGGVGVTGVATVAAATAFGLWKAWQAESKPGKAPNVGGMSPAEWKKFNADRMAQQFGRVGDSIKAASTRLDGMRDKLGKSSRAMELVGHSADRAFNGDAAKGVANATAKLQRFSGAKAEQAFDLIGHSASKNTASAGANIDILTGKLNHIPDSKKISITANVSTAMMNIAHVQYAVDRLHNKTIIVRAIGGHVPGDPGSGGGGAGAGGAGAGASRGFGRSFVNPGVALITGLVDGIKKGFVRLPTAIAKVTDYLKTQRDKLQNLMSARTQFASGFQSFTTSLFGADYGQDATGKPVMPDVAGILAYQQTQATQAAKVRADVHKLIKMGLSKSLIKQLQAGGQSGIAQLSALASASPAQIAQLNALNAQTSSDLGAAGMDAGNVLYGKQIVQTRNNVDLAKRLAHELRQMGDHGKGEFVVVTVNGNEIIKAIRKTKRLQGQGSNV